MRRMIMANALACLAGRSWRSSAAALAIVVGLGGGSAVAQQTFANISGAVTRADGGPVQAITVEITHVPSGTRIVTAVGEGGRFNATGLRIGGPYTLRFSGEGLRDVVVERARLEPNEADPVNVTLVASDDGSEEDIVVIARRPAGTITDDDILVTPQIDRRLQDIVRLDSRAFVDRAQPEEDNGISILGFNTRFNNLVVDGLSQQDSFGQSFDGLPTRRAPVSLDAVESLAVQTAPFDVLNTNFQGGQINITTKSGGNEFHGSAFYQRTGGFLTGNRAGTTDAGLPVEFAPEQPENVWGATISGPILKDRLFFLLNYEEFDENDVLGSCPVGILCDNPNENLSLATYERIRTASIANYGIDPGDFNDFLSLRDGERRFVGKLDWNINDDHRASVTVQRSSSSNVGFGVGGLVGLGTPSSLVSEDRRTTGVSAQLFSRWTDRFSTQVLVAWRDQNRVFSPLIPQAYGTVVINDISDLDGDADGLVETTELTDLTIGTTAFSQFNDLDTRRLQFRFRGQYDLQTHEISFGYDRDSNAIDQLITPNARGTFNFSAGNGQDVISNFEDAFSNLVTVTVPLDGDPNSLIADYTAARNGWFIQDIWRPTPDLDVLLGLRYERFSQDERPQANPFFAGRYGITNTATLDGRDVFQPRFQTTWRAFDRTTLRGGIGVFAGGVPFAFFNETFITDGVTATTPQVTNVAGVNPNQLPTALQTLVQSIQVSPSQSAEGDVSALDPGFEIPRNLRFLAAIDQEFDVPFLGKDWRFTFEFTHSEVLQALQFIDLRPVQQILNGQRVFLADGTPRFITPPVGIADARPGGAVSPFRASATNDALEQDLLITNTQLGFTQVYFAELEKDWRFGKFGNLNWRGSYSFTRSQDVSPANDTDNLADVFETGAYSLVNNPTAAQSIQAIPHNLIYQFTWNKDFFKKWNAQLFLVGNYRSGRATSLTVNVPNTVPTTIPNVQLLQPGFSQRANDRLLAYLPSGANDPLVRYVGGASFAQLQEVIDGLGLQEFQGSILPRNFLRAQDTHQIDIGGSISIPMPRGRLKLEGAVENFLNLFDRDRGVIRRFAIREDLYQSFFDPATGQFVITGIDPGADLFSLDEQPVQGFGSRWRARIGIRYEF